MYVGVVELLRNLPLYGGEFGSPTIRDLENRRDVLTGQSTGWALVNSTSRRSLRLLCGEYRQIECKHLYAIWRRNHGEQSMYRRDGVVLGPIVGAFGDMSSHVDLLADVIADALTAELLLQ